MKCDFNVTTLNKQSYHPYGMSLDRKIVINHKHFLALLTKFIMVIITYYKIIWFSSNFAKKRRTM